MSIPSLNPYEPTADAQDSEATIIESVSPETFGLIAWLLALVFHAAGFQTGLAYGIRMKSKDDPSEWFGYLIFGNSEFGYVLAACLCGGVIAEIYRWLVHRWLQRSTISSRQTGNVFCGAIAATSILLGCVAAMLG